ncbi:MAG: Cytochrome c551 peroxidase [Chlorobi bacterium]|nr:MAG: Cytochrome c551 peroxidase precursor [Chlorobi bacterium OLB6]MBV6462887.1 Cytochrome c551 peroxidase [Chlorobiota bacterium]WKZ77767.1 MAG: cytochrome c peroxidase [Candidatus Kapabacteria bacterium]
MFRYLLPCAFVLLMGCSSNEESNDAAALPGTLTITEEQELAADASDMFGVLPATMPGAEHDTPDLIALGEALYHDVRLSINNTQSCNTCHDVTNGRSGVDGEPTSKGAKGERGNRNSPTSLNAGFQFLQFWDGRAADLAEQAKGPILNPVEMAMPSEKAVEDRLSGIPEYVEMFKKAFPNTRRNITYQNVASAIAAFERTLVSPSPFDEYVKGNSEALTAKQKLGLQTFIATGCASCHNGPTFGGNTFQKLGMLHPFASKDAGRYEVTKDPADSMMFKVPILRNIALTAPYFHNGSVPTLHEAVKLMAWHQLDKKLDENEIDVIVTFLEGLSDPKRTAPPAPAVQ